MAVYGLITYDIRHENALGAQKVPALLRRLAAPVTKSAWLFEWGLRDRVLSVLSRYAANDSVQPPMRVHQDDERTARQWARTAFRGMLEDVIPKLRQSIEHAEKKLTDEEFGIIDASGFVDNAAKRAHKKLEDAMVALATFRLSGEFEDLRDSVLMQIEAQKDRVTVTLTKKALEAERTAKT